MQDKRRIATTLALSCALIMAPFWGSYGAVAQSSALESALKASAEENWPAARRAAGAPGSVVGDIIEWQRLRAGEGTAREVQAFLERRGDWPGLALLRRQSEDTMAGASHDAILTFYATSAPQTALGALSHTRALIAAGRQNEGEGTLIMAWRNMPMPAEVQQHFLSDYRRLLRDHHEARLSELLWNGHTASAGRMLDLVPRAPRALAEARIALQEDKNGVDALIQAIPRRFANDPGLAYDRFAWRDRKRRADAAIALLQERSTSAEALGMPQKWLSRRRDHARQLMRDRKYRAAYQLAANHHATSEDGYGYADSEWIAGYVALRFLDDAPFATYHFTRFLGAVKSPISMGRAGYWLGRSYGAQGEVDKAHAAYQLGAKFQTSFYGLLSAEALGRPFPTRLTNPPKTQWEAASFLQSSVAAAGLAALKAGDRVLAERFLTHLVEDLDADQALELGQMAADLGEPHLAVMISKRAARDGQELAGAYYPLHPVAEQNLPMAPEMVLAIARRESEFDPVVISHAGARGLMQVMPATARKVAEGLGIAGHQTAQLTRDWRYNARLGAAYLAQLAGDFDGNVVLMSAGYNAGPHRADTWMERYGDPRDQAVDMVDWIEHIPFNETRNYVMRVTESLPIYRARLGKDPLPQPFSQELSGRTLQVFAPKSE